MPNIITSEPVKAFMQSTDTAGMRSAVGLGNVNNTSDANKPVSTAVQAALDGKEPTIEDGFDLPAAGGSTIGQQIGNVNARFGSIGESTVSQLLDGKQPLINSGSPAGGLTYDSEGVLLSSVISGLAGAITTNMDAIGSLSSSVESINNDIGNLNSSVGSLNTAVGGKQDNVTNALALPVTGFSDLGTLLLARQNATTIFYAFLASSETRTDTNRTAPDGFSVPVLAGQKWIIECSLITDCGPGGFGCGISAPSNAGYEGWMQLTWDQAGVVSYWVRSPFSGAVVGTAGVFFFRGNFGVTVAADGFIQITAGLYADNETPSTLKAGSWMRAVQVG